MSDTVLIAVNGYRTQKQYHTDEDCPHLRRAHEVREKPRDAYPTARLCEYCRTGEYHDSGDSNGWKYRRQLEAMAHD